MSEAVSAQNRALEKVLELFDHLQGLDERRELASLLSHVIVDSMPFHVYTIGPLPEWKPYLCVDCASEAIPNPATPGTREYYMVRDEVWKKSGLGPDGGHLCLDCLEVRIGRPLTGADLKPGIRINRPDRFDSPKMAALKRHHAELQAN